MHRFPFFPLFGFSASSFAACMQSQVYVQVEMLFKDAPDLLAEFKDFLPDAIGPGGMHPGALAMLPQTMSGGWPPGDASPPMASRKGVQSKRRKKFPEKE